ncbi:MAG: exo-alpha-sialidase [bacterium]|nr:exo-alpha-sialidase [bacterium]
MFRLSVLLFFVTALYAAERPFVPRSSVVSFGPELSRSPWNALDDAGPNARMNQDTFGRRQNEITMAAWILDPRVVMGGSNDYRNGDASGGFYVSTDGGSSFGDVLVTRGPAGVFEAAGDPVAAIDRNGRLYATHISFDRTTDDGGLYSQTSDDFGQTWSGPLPIAEHIDEPGADFEDKPYTCCDVSPVSPFVNTHYVTWTRFQAAGGSPIFVSHTTGGEPPYSTPVRVSESDACQFSCPATGPNGEVYAVFIDYWTARIKFDKSLDGGNTGHRCHRLADVGPLGTGQSLRHVPHACLSDDRLRQYRGPRHGWIYVCWVTFNGTDPDVMISHSTDGGTTWSAAARVDDGPVGTWQWWQWLAVHPKAAMSASAGWTAATTPTAVSICHMPAYPPTALLSPPSFPLDRAE